MKSFLSVDLLIYAQLPDKLFDNFKVAKLNNF